MDSKVYIYRLANLFGKWCRPNYNSVTATWCYNVANGKDIQINDPNVELPLCYIDDVVNEFINALEGHPTACKEGIYEVLFHSPLKTFHFYCDASAVLLLFQVLIHSHLPVHIPLSLETQ